MPCDCRHRLHCCSGSVGRRMQRESDTCDRALHCPIATTPLEGRAQWPWIWHDHVAVVLARSSLLLFPSSLLAILAVFAPPGSNIDKSQSRMSNPESESPNKPTSKAHEQDRSKVTPLARQANVHPFKRPPRPQRPELSPMSPPGLIGESSRLERRCIAPQVKACDVDDATIQRCQISSLRGRCP